MGLRYRPPCSVYTSYLGYNDIASHTWKEASTIMSPSLHQVTTGVGLLPVVSQFSISIIPPLTNSSLSLPSIPPIGDLNSLMVSGDTAMQGEYTMQPEYLFISFTYWKPLDTESEYRIKCLCLCFLHRLHLYAIGRTMWTIVYQS